MLTPAAPGQAQRRILPSCHTSTNRDREPNTSSNFKNGGDNFHCILFVTGRYFEFLSVHAFNISLRYLRWLPTTRGFLIYFLCLLYLYTFRQLSYSQL